MVESSAGLFAEYSAGTLLLGGGIAILVIAGTCYAAYKLYKFFKGKN